jgi:hypothetical protein
MENMDWPTAVVLIVMMLIPVFMILIFALT